MAKRDKESVLDELTAYLIEYDIEDYHLDIKGGKISVAYREDFDALCLRVNAKPVKDTRGRYAVFKYNGWVVSGRIDCSKPVRETD